MLPEMMQFQKALMNMAGDATGQQVLRMLRLDGFATADPTMFDSIAKRMDAVRRAG
jgi:phosphonate transport system substrate-binding protein